MNLEQKDFIPLNKYWTQMVLVPSVHSLLADNKENKVPLQGSTRTVPYRSAM
jgi:hypothetical protein